MTSFKKTYVLSTRLKDITRMVETAGLILESVEQTGEKHFQVVLSHRGEKVSRTFGPRKHADGEGERTTFADLERLFKRLEITADLRAAGKLPKEERYVLGSKR